MKILIIDIETTGFLPDGKIVEVGIVELNTETKEKQIIFDKVFNPRLPVSEIENSWIVKNGYMTVEEIMSGGNIEDFIGFIQNQIDQYPDGSTAYNNRFDFDFLESVGIKFPKKLPCPMLLSTDICKLPGQFGGYKWPKVEEAWHFFFGDTGYIEKHRGADDAFHEAEIVIKLIEMGIFFPALAIKNQNNPSDPNEFQLSIIDKISNKETAMDNVVQHSGLNPESAQESKAKYLPFLGQISEIVEEARAINYLNPTEHDELTASNLRKRTVKIRTAAASLKDERKKIHLLRGNLEQSAYNLIKSDCELIEESFRQIENYSENQRLEKEAQLKTERLALITPYLENPEFYPIEKMEQEQFDSFLADQKTLHEAKEKAKKDQEEAARLQQEKQTLMADRIATLKNNFFQFALHNQITTETTEKEFKEIWSLSKLAFDEDAANQQKIKDENEKLKRLDEIVSKRVIELSRIGFTYDGVLFHHDGDEPVKMSVIKEMADNEFAAFILFCANEFDKQLTEKMQSFTDLLIQNKWVRFNKDSFKKAHFILAVEMLMELPNITALQNEITRIDALIKDHELEQVKQKARADLEALNKSDDATKIRHALSELKLNFPELNSENGQVMAHIISEKFKGFLDWAELKVQSIE